MVARGKKKVAKQKRSPIEPLADPFRMLVSAVEVIRDYGIFMLDPEGHILTWNSGAYRLKGYTEKEILGKHFSLFYTEHDRQRQHPAAELKAAIEFGRYEEEGWRVRKDGTRFWANVVITKLTAKGGSLIGFSKVTRDLTERKLAEDRLRFANQELEVKIAERMAALAATNERLLAREMALEAAVNVRDDFLSIAAHELKTPLTSLKLQVQLGEMQLANSSKAPLSTEKLKRIFRVCHSQADRLNVLVDDLLDVGRIERGSIVYKFEVVNLRTMAESVLERFGEALRLKKYSLECGAEEPLLVYADTFRLEQVLINLLSNSVKFGHEKPVWIRLGREGDRIFFSVVDQGMGIAKDKQLLIFERFERAISARNISGLGLGLFISRRIVEAHRGSISVQSELGNGSVFKVSLPKAL